ncbi:MAG: 30S ribosomal protein S6 [Elusimicrobiales bacterium]
MRIYELTIILKPQLSDAEVAAFVDKSKKQIAADGGEVLVEEKQGRRRLFHEVDKNREGFYVFLRFKGTPQCSEKFGAQLRVNETVLRFMAIRSDEKETSAAAPKPAPKPAAVK